MKSLAVRLLAFILLLALLQFTVSSVFPVEIPQEILHAQKYLSDQVDIIYLGDSTLSLPAGEVTTGEILQEMLPGYTVGEVSHAAYNLDLYLHYVRYIIRSVHRPQVIIIPINMRSFSPEWDLRPGYQFEKEKKMLTLGPFFSRILSRPLETFGVFEPQISQDAFLNATVYNGDTPVGTVKDFESLADQGALQELQGDTGFVYHDVLPSEENAEALQQALIYRYMHGLKPDHRQLQAMLKIAELGNENDVGILFYITPINYQQGQRFLGDAFSESLDRNASLIQSLLANDTGVTLLDLAFDLEAYAFTDMEHLREAGKTYVAERLAGAIQPGWSVASSGHDSEATPAILPPGSGTVTPGATFTPTDLPPSPTVTRPAPAAVETRMPALSTVAVVTLAPTPTEPSPSPPVSTVVATATPLVTATVSPTPTLTRVAQDDIAGGNVVEAGYLWRSWPEGKYAVDMYRLRYQTLDENGQIAETQADLFVPHVETTATFPILVHAAGTTGLSDGCAPLNEQTRQRNWGNYRGHSLAYAAQGYIVILPNGLGFDDPDRIHPYFVAELQAHVSLDAARAVYGFADDPPAGPMLAQPAEAVFFMGYSSGGHAAFAAKDLAGSYAPELPVKGIIGHGPTTNIETLLREDPVFSPYIIYAYRDFYGDEIIDVADVFLPRWVPTFGSDVLSKCVDDIFYYYSRSAREMYTPRFREILYGDRLDQVYPLFAAKLSANHAGVSGGSRIPVLILQGTADTVVTPDSQRAFKDQLCEQGNVVTYLEYPAVPHVEIRWTSFSDTLSWMRRIVNGDIPETDCEIINVPR
jgi:dienelactone hydrolase